jgi:hypothetical protein
MEAEAKLQHQKDLARQRAKRYYEKNRDKILTKRKEKTKIKPIESIEPLQSQPEPEAKPELTPNDYTEEQLIMLISQQGYPERTLKTYTSDIKRLFKITECNTILPCLKRIEKIISQLELGVYDENKNYSINTIKQTLQVLLIIINRLLVNDPTYNKKLLDKISDRISQKFQQYKELSLIENNEKVEKEVVPTFSEYLGKVKKLFGTESKEYLISLLYSIFTVRDNFKNMKLIRTEADNDGVNNFIFFYGNQFKIFINKFKTQNSYKKLIYIFNPKNGDEQELKKLIQKYISRNMIMYGDYLFGKAPMSDFVSSMNKELGYSSGINLFRHMKVSETINKNLSFDERYSLSKQMGHSIGTQQKYKRNIIIS